MRAAQAIRTGFAKSFDTSGRASRVEFAWRTILSLAFVGLLVGQYAVVTADAVAAVGRSWPASSEMTPRWLDSPFGWIAALLALTHLFATGARRSFDAGLAVAPLVLLGGVAIASVAYLAFYATQIWPADAEAGDLYLAFASYLFGPASAIVLFIALLRPTQPSTTEHGPNPSEALQ
jgi:uncharacterized membrane protein YhaH (DUF805 family)